MVAYSGEELTVSTWGDGKGPDAPQRWIARWGPDPFWAYFYTDERRPPVHEVFALGQGAREQWEAEHPGERPPAKVETVEPERADDYELGPDGSLRPVST